MDTAVTSEVTIVQVEEAINYYRSRHPVGDDAALCKDARVLADLYGRMIFENLISVWSHELSVQVKASLAGADQEH